MESHDYSDVNNYLEFNVASQSNWFSKSLSYQIKIDPSELISTHSAKAEGKRKIADRAHWSNSTVIPDKSWRP